jgi:cbb3-type cytochrome oxidase maturation protein
VSLGLLIGLSIALGIAAWLFFLWTVRSGQYEDPEGPKYRMLDDDDGAPPAPHGGGRDPSTRRPGEEGEGRGSGIVDR